LDISKDEIPTDKGFVTNRMLSDTNLSEEVRNNPNLHPYTGNYDCVSNLRNKKYPDFPQEENNMPAA
jgi:nitrogenase molybdenum-iron protein alpha chain